MGMFYTDPEVIPGWNDIHSPFFWVNVFELFLSEYPQEYMSIKGINKQEKILFFIKFI